MLYTSVVKLPASTSEHIKKPLFQLTLTHKMVSTQCILYRAKQAVIGRWQMCAVSRMGKNSPAYFCDCLTHVQAGVMMGIVVKEKNVLHILVGRNYADTLLQFV
jgi:hypothetical protein